MPRMPIPDTWRRPPPQQRFVKPSGAPLAPIIDEVTVEKPSVCRGEENLVTVKAHTEGHAEDAYLRYVVSGEDGDRVPLYLRDRSDEARGVQREVLVFGRGGVVTSVPLPAYEIRDCEVPAQLVIAHSMLANSETEFELQAKITTPSAKPVEVAYYRWDFGDGTQETSQIATVEHDFGGRPQDTMFSQDLITCTAMTADGVEITGRGSLQLMNVAFEELAERGVVRISSAMTPRFPEMDDRGVVRQKVHLWHFRPEAVQITRIVAVKNYLPSKTDGHTPEPHGEDLDPSVVLGGATSIPPGEGLMTQVELDPRGEALSRIDFYIEGVSAEGMPAHGNFSVMRPPDRPTKDNSEPVVSEYMKAKIQRAQELLGQAYVTDEDIWMLERDGQMDDIKPEDYPQTGDEPEPTRPPEGPTSTGWPQGTPPPNLEHH
jgi:hypothetical protein